MLTDPRDLTVAPPRRPVPVPVLLSLLCALLLAGAGCRPEGALPGTSDGPPAGEAGRPNIVLVMTDDQGWGDLRLHGNPHLDTPVIDRLAAEGTRFDRFYVSPVCAPTRASLLTGRYHLRTGTAGVTRGLETMRAQEVTLAEVLREAGYATGLFGKWHNGAHYPESPRGQGFETFFGFAGGHWNNYFDTPLHYNEQVVPTKGYITDVLTDSALAFIERHRARPFFLYVPYNAPHAPFQVPDRYYDRYAARGLDAKTAAAYAMVENIDENAGRLLERLAALGLEERTIVIFMTDNGPNGARYNGGMRGTKASVHEGGVRVPFIVRWPGEIAPGAIVERIAAHIDVMPTLLELAGVALPEAAQVDGRSLVPLLQGEVEAWPERRLFSHHNREREGLSRYPGAVRTDRYRLVRTGEAWELYDMRQDPGQKRDVAAEHPEVVAALSGAYERWFDEVAREGVARPPIPVGHRKAPLVELPAPEAFFTEPIRYADGPGYAHDWLTNWTSTEAAAWWELDVAEAGRYAVTLLYTAPEAAVGARVRVEAGGQAVEGVVAKAVPHEPTVRPERDRSAQRLVKAFAPLELGTLSLPRGRTRLTARPVALPGGRFIDLSAVRLRRIE